MTYVTKINKNKINIGDGGLFHEHVEVVYVSVDKSGERIARIISNCFIVSVVGSKRKNIIEKERKITVPIENCRPFQI
jgi:hypothetical protein